MQLDFSSEYSKLNPKQKAAVDYIEGPLLVIAGPGTGKTQLLSLRAANILKQTDALPENILCLTFTESGTQAMRNRLISIIGEAAYNINISTYHGFGSELINRNPNYFEGSFNLRPINELRADSIIRELQKGLAYSSIFKYPEMVKAISELISDAKQSVLTPKDLQEVAKANLTFIKQMSEVAKPLTKDLARASIKSAPVFTKLMSATPGAKLPNSIEPLSYLWNNDLTLALEDTENLKKATSLSRWKAKYLAKDENGLQIAKGELQNNRLIEFSEIYQKYLDKLKTNNLYDYDDMILRSIDAIRKHDDLRFNLQEKYLYIMLDEYQDTNLAQAELVYLLTNNKATEGRPNVMAVGDDDQAIYAFQGAKHSNMLDFTRQYRDVKQITLETNYRSTQPLIHLSSNVADKINERLTNMVEGINKEFKSAKKTPGEITHLKFNNEVEEYAWLSRNIAKNKSQEIAVISPEHKYLERASAYLINQGIDISYERRESVLDDPLINQILTILRLIIAINDNNSRLVNSLAASVLNFDFLGLPTETIWKLSWQASDKHEPWLKVMLEGSKTRTLALMLIKLASNSLSYRYDFIIDQIIGLSDIVIEDPKTKSTRSPFLSFLKDEQDISKLFQNLLVLREQFIDYNGDNDKPLMITDLIDFIDQLKASNIKLTNDFNYGKNNSKVKLMTAHGAKGQEFDTVYLLSLTNEVWGPKRSYISRLSLPPNLEYIRQSASDSDDEKLRLLYVALTRAKDKLMTLSYDQDISGKLTTPLKYLETSPTANEEIKAELIPLWQASEDKLEIKSDLKELLKRRLDNYKLSPTELNSFIDIRNAGPQAFYRNHILKYRTPTSPRMDYGNAIHDSLDWLQKTLSTSGQVPTLSNLLREFENELRSRRLLTHDFDRLKEQGIESLTSYYKERKANFSKDDISEHSFGSESLSVGKARISGKIDKLVIDKKSKSLQIVDYKTGKGYKNWVNQPKLHLYKNQLYFYKLLVENSRAFKEYEVSGAALDFVEPDSLTHESYELPLTYNASEAKRYLKLIAAVWKHIENLDFPNVDSYKPNLTGIKQFEDDLIEGKI